MDAREIIARRVARELTDGAVVNLGIGLPTEVARYLPADKQVTLQSENGFLGLGPLTDAPNPNLTDASGQPCGLVPGAAMFDCALSFALIRGGHVNVTVLGGLEVDQDGNLANWMVPGKLVPGMGGAMDLVAGACRVIVAMEHCTRDGAPRIVAQCSLPLTGRACVDLVVTELALFAHDGRALVLRELAPGVTLDTVRARTGAAFEVDPRLCAMPL